VQKCGIVVPTAEQEWRRDQSMSHTYAPHETTYRAPRFASTGQVEFMERILTRNEFYFTDPVNGGHYDRLWKLLEAHRIAAKTIDWLLRREAECRAAPPAPEPELFAAPPAEKTVAATPGVYRKDGEVYVVVPNKQNTRVYAKRLVESPPRLTSNGEEVDFELVYTPGVIWDLTEANRMSLEDARDYIIRYGRCIKCHARLKAAKTLKDSAETGIIVGATCRKYFS
jgi:hypothetical protein